MGALEINPDAVADVADRLHGAADRVRSSPPLPLGGPPEVTSAVSLLAHAERRLADASAALLDGVGVHAQQVVTGLAVADR